MNTIELTTATPDLKHNLDFLIKLEFVSLYRRTKIGFTWLLIFTAFYLFLILLPETDRNIPLKGVFTIVFALIWIATFIVALIILAKYFNRRKWKKRTLHEAFSNPQKFRFSWDCETLGFSTDKYETTLKWEMYKYYTENKNTIYIFNDRNTYEALYYTENELGRDYYQNLKEIVSAKLVLLSEAKELNTESVP